MKKKILALLMITSLVIGMVGCATEVEEKKENATEVETVEGTETDVKSSASADATTSASVMQSEYIQEYIPKGFTDGEKKKALFVVGDPRKDSVNYDLINTAMKHFEENNVEVEIRDLYDMNFNPVLMPEDFFYAKDGKGEPSEVVKTEQGYVTKADYIIFGYANWHDTPNAIVKGYMEKVFAKKYAYEDTAEGLRGMLTEKSIFTIMNAGFLGGGRGDIGDGVGMNDATWDEYLKAFKVLDDDTAGFWGVENKGRFVNDRTPKNNSENFEVEINELRESLKSKLDIVYSLK